MPKNHSLRTMPKLFGIFAHTKSFEINPGTLKDPGTNPVFTKNTKQVILEK